MCATVHKVDIVIVNDVRLESSQSIYGSIPFFFSLPHAMISQFKTTQCELNAIDKYPGNNNVKHQHFQSIM